MSLVYSRWSQMKFMYGGVELKDLYYSVWRGDRRRGTEVLGREGVRGETDKEMERLEEEEEGRTEGRC